MNQAIASHAVMAALAAMFAVAVAAQTGVIAPDAGAAAAQGGTSASGAAPSGGGGTHTQRDSSRDSGSTSRQTSTARKAGTASPAADKPMAGERATTMHARSKSATGAAHGSARMREHPGDSTAGRRAESQYHAALRKCVEQNPVGQRDSCLQEAIDRHARG